MPNWRNCKIHWLWTAHPPPICFLLVKNPTHQLYVAKSRSPQWQYVVHPQGCQTFSTCLVGQNDSQWMVWINSLRPHLQLTTVRHPGYAFCLRLQCNKTSMMLPMTGPRWHYLVLWTWRNRHCATSVCVCVWVGGWGHLFFWASWWASAWRCGSGSCLPHRRRTCLPVCRSPPLCHSQHAMDIRTESKVESIG